MRIYVGNLPFSTTEAELQSLFEQHGEVVSASVVTDRETGRSRGFGFVEMKEASQAQEAIEALNGTDLAGRNLTVNEASPRVTGSGTVPKRLHGASGRTSSGGFRGNAYVPKPHPQDEVRSVGLTKIELTIDAPFKEFTDSDEERFAEALRLILSTNTINVLGRREGSTKIMIEIDWEYAESLLDAICHGALADYNVIDIEFLEASLAKAIVNRKRRDGRYDVFMCHNSQDKEEVVEIAGQLERRGLLPWVDEVDLKPGTPWQRAIEDQIEQIGSVAVFIGGHGNGPWQALEIEAFVREFVNRGSPVIPAILASCTEPKLPPFLNGMHRVDFRKERPSPIAQLAWGITGTR